MLCSVGKCVVLFLRVCVSATLQQKQEEMEDAEKAAASGNGFQGRNS